MILACLCSSGPEFPDTLENTQSISMCQNQRPPSLVGICLYLNTVISIANATYWVIIDIDIQKKNLKKSCFGGVKYLQETLALWSTSRTIE